MLHLYTTLSFRFSSSLLLLLTCALAMQAQNLVRGPYLQMPTPESIIIMWRTDIATTSSVSYGKTVNSLVNTVNDDTPKIDHLIEITNLKPNTRYFYSINSLAVPIGNNEQHRFTTLPPPNTIKPTRIWAIGDFGKGNEGQRQVRNSYINYTDSDSTATDVWLWLGDNAYPDGSDTDYQEKVFNSYYGYDSLFRYMPFWPTPGNHDYFSVNSISGPASHTGPYYDIVEVPQNAEAGGYPSNYELFYSFDYGNIHFISLNSELWQWVADDESPMAQWLINDLENNDKEWLVAFWHQPPYSKGSHDSDDLWELFMAGMRNTFNPILEQYGVDLVLCGHSHVFERSKFINGHYSISLFFNDDNIVMEGSGNEATDGAYVKHLNGTDAGKGTVYVVCGNSGSYDSNPDLDHPAMYFSEGGSEAYGSFVADVLGNKLTGRYLSSTGQILDEFTIIKPDGGIGDIDVRTNIILEGRYNNTLSSMNTDLFDNNLLPTTQPFNQAPWLYNGIENIGSINELPNQVVDWVLAELRHSTNTDSVVAQSAALLLNNGEIISATDCTPGIKFKQIDTKQAYHLVIRTRNHLDIMSKDPIDLLAFNTIDFSNNSNLSLGNNQLKVADDGRFMLIAGDIDGNGLINVADFNLYYNQNASVNLYNAADIDGNGNITIHDFNLYQSNSSTIGISEIRY